LISRLESKKLFKDNQAAIEITMKLSGMGKAAILERAAFVPLNAFPLQQPVYHLELRKIGFRQKSTNV